MMKHCLPLLLATLLATCLAAQDYATHFPPPTPTTAATPAALAPVTFRQLPALPDELSLVYFLDTHLKYPELARSNCIEGTVVLALAVSATGEITAGEVVRNVHPLLDRAALDVIGDLPRLLPAMVDGHPLACTMMLPIRFSLR